MPNSQPLQSATGEYSKLVRDNRNFRYLWLGQIVSLLGDWFNLIASASLIASLTGSGVAVGSLFAVRMLAPFLVSPVAGVVADKYNRKVVLIIADLARALVVFGFLLVRDAGDVWLLYVLTAIQLGISGFFFPTRNAILPDIVDRSQLGAANALSSATWSIMLAVGTALGGLVSGGLGIYPAFVVDGLTFILSALILALITYKHTPALADVGHGVGQMLSQYVEGLRYLRQNQDVFKISLHKAVSALIVSGGFQVITVILGQRIYVIGEGGGVSLGILFAVTGIGTGIGPILARRSTGDRDHPLRVALGLSYIVAAVGVALTAPLLGFGLVLIGMFLRGAGGGVIWVFSTQLLLQLTPDRVRGRVFSTEFAIFSLANAIGAIIVGLALDNTSIGLGAMMWWMAVLSIIAGVLWLYHTAHSGPDTPSEST